ncbi:hypothetical protein ACQP25_33675 [Microtetraspora malaysiensis]|uniref:hypothetical protein n=1 Tax=Microtetraspora malaysiensis TaxID=161358 RepID=UPI003D8BD94A
MIFVLPLIVAGCGIAGEKQPQAVGESPDDVWKVKIIGDDPRILVHASSGVPMEAPIRGILIYDNAKKCLLIKDWNGPNKHGLPVWRQGTEPVYENHRRGVKVPSGDVIFDGEQFAASGGSMAADKIGMKEADLANLCKFNFEYPMIINGDAHRV